MKSILLDVLLTQAIKKDTAQDLVLGREQNPIWISPYELRVYLGDLLGESSV